MQGLKASLKTGLTRAKGTVAEQRYLISEAPSARLGPASGEGLHKTKKLRCAKRWGEVNPRCRPVLSA